MRFVLAITALVLSGILLILGIGQTTFLAGPKRVVTSVQFDAANGLAVIPDEVAAAVAGQANVVMTGVSPVIAVGHDRDVQAWAAPFAHSLVTIHANGSELAFEAVAADNEAAEAYAAVHAPAADAADDAEAEAEAPAVLPELEVPNPSGSDLWLEERAAPEPLATEESEVADAAAEEDSQQNVATQSTVRLPVKLASDQSALVYVVDSQNAELSIEWVQDRRTPWAGPLLVGGGLLALIGVVLYLWAVDHDRRGLGPRRGRKGPLLGIRNMFASKPKSSASASTVTGGAENPASDTVDRAAGRRESLARRRIALPVLALSSALVLSGCSPSYWPELSPQPTEDVADAEATEPAPNVAPVPVTEGQLNRILDDIVEIANFADDELDASELSSRFVGDALVEREANYKIRAAVSDYDVVVPRITDEALGYQLVQSTESWPRTIFTVVASENGAEQQEPEAGEETAEEATPAESPSLALIMTQANPHVNYLVSRTIALRGGITMPEAAPVEEGTARLANDIKSLVMMPQEVGPSYAKVLASGADVEEAEFFDLEDDSLLQRSGLAWVAQSTEAAQAAGQGIVYSVSAEQSNSRVISLSTGVGGALVATTVHETRVEEPEEGGRWRPTVPKSLAALSGLEGQQDKLVSVVAHQLLFFVPSALEGGQIELLGYTSDLIEARNS